MDPIIPRRLSPGRSRFRHPREPWMAREGAGAVPGGYVGRRRGDVGARVAARQSAFGV